MVDRMAIDALQYLGYALEIALVAVILGRKWWKEYTAFSLYVIAFVLADVAIRPLFLDAYGFSSRQYRQCYWFTDIALTLAAFLLVCVFFRHACSDRKERWAFARTMLGVVFVGIVAASILSISSHYDHLFGRFIVDLQQNLYFACLVLSTVLFVMLESRDSDGELGLLVCGLGIEFAGPAAGMALAYLTPGGHFAGVVTPLVAQLCNVAMFIVWLYALTRRRIVSVPPAELPRQRRREAPVLAEVRAGVR